MSGSEHSGIAYEVVIGCEVHVQLSTSSKAFCQCENSFGGEPNSRVCPVCMGLPGSMPVVNRALIDGAILAGLALNCEIAETTKFDRKNYVYPDLPKGYQISQLDAPICTDGYLDVLTDDGSDRRVGISRVHAEEDAGKNLHGSRGSPLSYVDFNRCGTPLLEIVSLPDLRSPGEAMRYVQSIREIMRYLEISDCNMEEASLRCDANINLWIRGDGEQIATPIAEVKNMNSFRSIRSALEFEERRQLFAWRKDGLTLQDVGKTTRGFDENRGETLPQRSKEESADYRYFPEPDLRPISISRSHVEALRRRVGELPEAKRRRLVEEYGLKQRDAAQISASRALSDYFEATAAGFRDPTLVANWLLADVKKYLNSTSTEISTLSVTPQAMRELLIAVDAGEISGTMAKQVFIEMARSGDGPSLIIERLGLRQLSDEDSIIPIVDSVIAEHQAIADEYRAGKQNALKFLMGQLMKATRGKANPRLADELLRRRLSK